MMSFCASSSISLEQVSEFSAVSAADTCSKARVETKHLLKVSSSDMSEQGSESLAKISITDHVESQRLPKALSSEQGSETLAADSTFSKSSSALCDLVVMCCNSDYDETENESDEEKSVYCVKETQTPWSSSSDDDNCEDADKKADQKERKRERNRKYRLKQRSKQLSEPKTDLKCSCDYVTKRRYSFHTRTKKVYDNKSSLRLPCELCGKRFETHNWLNCHSATVHGMDVTYEARLCPNCGRHFFDRNKYVSHKRNCLHTGSLKCVYEGCNAVLGTADSLHSHYARVHLKRYEVTCSYCSKKFSGKNRLEKHISSVHLKLKPFSCTEGGCNKKFASNSSLTVHLRTHSKIPYLSCHYCNYACRQRNAMNWHMKKHPEALEESKTK